MSRAIDTLNQTITLKDVVKPGPITTLNIQMDIYITTNDETGTSQRMKARKSQKIFQKLSSTRTRRTIHTSRNKAILSDLNESMIISNDLKTGEETILGEKVFLHRKPTPPPRPVHLGFWMKL